MFLQELTLDHLNPPLCSNNECNCTILLFLITTGTKEIMAGVDEETGDVFLSLEACEVAETSTFEWSKNYKLIGDCPRVQVTAKGRT